MARAGGVSFNMPKESEVFRWIEDMYEFGPRRPGTAADRKGEDYLAEKLESFGLKNVRKEPIPIRVWEAKKYSLSVAARGGDFEGTDAFYVPYTAFTPAGGAEAELVYGAPEDVGKPASRNWKGKVVVADIRFPVLDFDKLKKLSFFVYDPDNNINESQHAAIWVRLHWNIYQEAARRGAEGFIGILADHYPGGQKHYAPYGFREKDIHDKPVTGFWLDCVEGDRVRALAKAGGARARMLLTGTLKDGPTHNVIGELPGASSEKMMIASHHDSPFASAVEDASGCAAVLAAAKHFAKSKEQLNRTLLFAFTAGHFYGSVGTRSFISSRKAGGLKDLAFEFHVEHIGRESVFEGGEMRTLERAEPAAAFMSFNRHVIKAVRGALEAEGLTRIVALPPEGPLGPYPPTDGGDFHEAGVPIVNLICGPIYLLNAEDTMDKVARDRLLPTARALVRVARDLDSVPLSRLRMNHYPFKTALMKVLGAMIELKAGKSLGHG